MQPSEAASQSHQKVTYMNAGRLVNSLSKKMEKRRQLNPPAEPTIFSAPKIVRSSDPDAYEPKLVSIGPYHRAKSKDVFKATEDLKWRLLHHYLRSRAKDRIDRFLIKMKCFEKAARSYYSERIDNIESNEFVEMLLLDGCFLVQIIIFVTRRAEKRPQELAQLFNNNMWFENLLLRDLLLLENQLPYFIVKDLLNASGIEERGAFCNALQWFNSCLPNQLSSTPPEELFQGLEQVHHLLHLFYKWIIIDLNSKKTGAPLTNKTKEQLFKLIPCCSGASDPQQEEHIPLINGTRNVSSGVILSCSGADSLKSLRSITSVIGLREAGVEVKAEGDNFLNISFDDVNGVLSIPAITVDDNTRFILRNLVAFEQCSYPSNGMDVTDYTLFMDHIINTPRDVELLCEAEIIDRKLGSDEKVASLFNEMCKGVVLGKKGNRLYNDVSDGVKKYCTTWRKWRAALMHDYFSNPWKINSVVAASVLLAATVLQTVYSLLSYYQW